MPIYIGMWFLWTLSMFTYVMCQCSVHVPMVRA